MSFRNNPALFMASYAMPPVSDPSPTIETTLKSLPAKSRAAAIPSPAEIAVFA